MSLLESKAIALARGDTTSQALKPDATRQKEAARAKLQKATKEFESLFSFYMLKAMRQSVSFGKGKQEGFLSSGLGKDTFTEMFDMKMAEKIATRGKQSISSLMYNQMVKQIDQKDAEHPLDTSLKGVRDTKSPAFKLNQHRSTPPSPEPVVSGNSQSMTQPPTDSHHRPEIVTNLQSEPFEFDLTLIPTKNIETNSPSEDTTADSKISKPSEPLVSSAHSQIFALYGEQIEKASQITSLDSSLIASVIHAESSGDAQAVSASGAKGLMQLMDSTAVQYDLSEPFDPLENITAGSRYLRDLIDRFGDLKLALAAYNAGPSNVRKFNGMPPFSETINYVSKVLDGYAALDETAKLPAAKENSVADR